MTHTYTYYTIYACDGLQKSIGHYSTIATAQKAQRDLETLYPLITFHIVEQGI